MSDTAKSLGDAMRVTDTHFELVLPDGHVLCIVGPLPPDDLARYSDAVAEWLQRWSVWHAAAVQR